MTLLAHAKRVVAALPHALRAQLREEPRSALSNLGVRVVDVPELTGDPDRGERWCDGLVLHDENTILIAPTPNSRRESFTVLHEYAHMLVEDDDDAIDWLVDRPDPDRDREALCNEIASRILIPESEVTAVVGSGPLRARHVQELHRRNPHASQMACVVALARRLPCAGAIVLTDRQDNRVVFASTGGDLDVRPRREVAVPPNHPLRRVTPSTPLTARSFWAEPWGESRELYLDATASDRRTYSIMLVNDVWGISDFHPEQPQTVRPDRPAQHVRCWCGVDREVSGWPCDSCKRVFCPSCGRCDCQRRDALLVRCRECTVSVAANDITNGLCSNCAP